MYIYTIGLEGWVRKSRGQNKQTKNIKEINYINLQESGDSGGTESMRERGLW